MIATELLSHGNTHCHLHMKWQHWSRHHIVCTTVYEYNLYLLFGRHDENATFKQYDVWVEFFSVLTVIHLSNKVEDVQPVFFTLNNPFGSNQFKKIICNLPVPFSYVKHVLPRNIS